MVAKSMGSAVHARLALLPSTIHCASSLRPCSASVSVYGVFSSRRRPLRACSSSAYSGNGKSGSAGGRGPQYPPPWFSVAPMMDWTDNHFRTLARLISKHAWLYTEMVVAETIVNQKDNLDRFLAFPLEQHPIVLQIGGSNLENLSKAAELASIYCYDEINLNCGCPSDKVAGHGCFGARLMLDPKVNAARRQGAYGVMIGRAAYNSPWNTLGFVDTAIYGAPGTSLSRRQVLEKFQVYGDAVLGKYGPNKPSVRQVVKPLLNLFHSEPGNGLWKRKADAALRHCTNIKSFLEETLDALPASVLDSALTTIPSTSNAVFADVQGLLPPQFKLRQEQYACV